MQNCTLTMTCIVMTMCHADGPLHRHNTDYVIGYIRIVGRDSADVDKQPRSMGSLYFAIPLSRTDAQTTRTIY